MKSLCRDFANLKRRSVCCHHNQHPPFLWRHGKGEMPIEHQYTNCLIRESGVASMRVLLWRQLFPKCHCHVSKEIRYVSFCIFTYWTLLAIASTNMSKLANHLDFLRVYRRGSHFAYTRIHDLSKRSYPMKLMCSWCLSEGRMAYLGERGALSDSRVSHVICEGHLVQLRAEGSRSSRTPLSSYQHQPTTSSRTTTKFEVRATSQP